MKRGGAIYIWNSEIASFLAMTNPSHQLGKMSNLTIYQFINLIPIKMKSSTKTLLAVAITAILHLTSYISFAQAPPWQWAKSAAGK